MSTYSDQVRKEFRQADEKRDVTADFPPTYLMTAPDDFLKMEAPEFAKKLTEENVPFVYRFYQDAEEQLGHVFHLNLRSKMATICNDEECRFFHSYL